MANYKESQITASKYQRARLAMIVNEKGFDPRIVFTEEQIVLLDDGSFVKNECGQVSEALTVDNATEQFDIIDDTGTVIGQSTYKDVYQLLSSLYLHMAAKRDNTPMVAPEPPSQPLNEGDTSGQPA